MEERIDQSYPQWYIDHPDPIFYRVSSTKIKNTDTYILSLVHPFLIEAWWYLQISRMGVHIYVKNVPFPESSTLALSSCFELHAPILYCRYQ